MFLLSCYGILFKEKIIYFSYNLIVVVIYNDSNAKKTCVNNFYFVLVLVLF
jgi:hypothetical protein